MRLARKTAPAGSEFYDVVEQGLRVLGGLLLGGRGLRGG